MNTLVLHFSSRCIDGADMATVLREGMPSGDIAAVMDERGAVSGYTVTLRIPDDDAWTDGLFAIRDLFIENGWDWDAEFFDADGSPLE